MKIVKFLTSTTYEIGVRLFLAQICTRQLSQPVFGLPTLDLNRASWENGTMTRRRLLLFGLLATVIVLGVGGWLLPPAGSVTHENYNRLYEGMTLQHACGILGTPSDSAPGDLWGGDPIPADLLFYIWETDDIRIFLVFNDDWTIQGGSKEFRDTNTGALRRQVGLIGKEGRFDVLRRWLRL